MSADDIYMNREIYSELGETLKEKLKAIWNNPDFINGVVDTLKTENNIQRMHNILDNGLTDRSKIVLLALSIQRGLV